MGAERRLPLRSNRESPNDPEVAIQGERPLEPARQQTKTRKTRARRVEVASSDDSRGDEGSDARLPVITFLDDVAALDGDIKQLRRQLAEKLLLQNAQLRRLLERFETS
ncbi:hypothetical protein [Ensifer sp. YR511]|uniref:hypothetical protein n=1 Tax=Ensifer sp. YR511 TaxID=1855294 RepID=UPI001AECA137|nr:hypothetical protein [Ensifer sp. YR511]